MKIIKAIVICFFAFCLVAATAVFIFFQVFDADQYLSSITEKASLALGRSVSVGHIGLGIDWQGFTLDAWPVKVADDISFTSQPFVRIDRVRIGVDLKALILRRQLHITRIVLQSPVVHFIRSMQGDINVYSLARPERVGISSSGSAAASVPAVQSSGPVGMSGEDKPLKAAMVPASIIIEDGAISFIDQSQGMPVDIWLDSINARLKSESPSVPLQLSFHASFYAQRPNVDGSALIEPDPSNRSVELKDLKFSVDLVHLERDRFKDAFPSLPDNPLLKDFTGAMQLDMADLNVPVSGALTGEGKVTVSGMVISDFNIIGTLVSRALGGFGGSMGGYLGKLGGKDTVIEKAQAGFSIHDKTVSIEDSSIQTDVLEAAAKGTVDEALNVDMQTKLSLNQDISASLVNQFDGFKYLMDDSKRISMDASLKGDYPHLKFKPDKDFRKKAKKALLQGSGNILGLFF